jgi:hypothetical protein
MALTIGAGRNGLIYVSGNEIVGANAWELNVTHAAAEGTRFGFDWTERVSGIKDWAGSITALHDQETEYLYSAATQNAVAALLIYPKRSDLTTYWSGNAVVSFRANADTDGLVGHSIDFSGAGSLTSTGFA